MNSCESSYVLFAILEFTYANRRRKQSICLRRPLCFSTMSIAGYWAGSSSMTEIV